MQNATTDPKQRRLNIVRYGLMVIPVVAWMIAFAPVFLASNGLGQNWISDALIPSLITAAIVGVVCAGVYYAYKRFVLNM
jgi:hypothetical protein